VAHISEHADHWLSLTDDFRNNLALCIKTSEDLIASLSRRLIDVSEPLVQAKTWDLAFRIRPPEIDQDALRSMPDSLADSYLSKRIEAQDFFFFIDERPFRYTELPPKTQSKFLEKYMPSLFWRSTGQVFCMFFYFLPFFFLFQRFENARVGFREAIALGAFMSAFLTCIMWVFLLIGSRRRLRPFPYEGLPSGDWSAFRLGIVQVAVLGLLLYPGIPICIIGYCGLGLFVCYATLFSLFVSLYLAQDYLRARIVSDVVTCLRAHLQLLASIRFVLSCQESAYQIEKQHVSSDIQAVEGLLRSQAKPTHARSLIKGAVTTVLGALIATVLPTIVSGEVSVTSLMNQIFRFQNLILFSSLCAGIGIMSWLLLRIRSRAQVKKAMAAERRLETLMKTGTQWVLSHSCT
jgi:hypothetical protein